MTTRPSPRQLPLFPTMPARFRLDDETVRRGRRHIAEIRKMLAASPPSHDLDRPTPVPRRHNPPRAA